MRSVQFACSEISPPHPRDRVCEQCEAPFRMRRPSGKAIAGKVREGRFCSKACFGASLRLYVDSREAKRAEKNRQRIRQGLAPLQAPPSSADCTKCGSLFVPLSSRQKMCSELCRQKHARDRASAAYLKPIHAVRKCDECAAYYTPEHGAAIYCSDACATRVHKRVARKKERARLRTLKVESVNPTKVFDRDRWCCQLCSVRTPRRLRGTIEPTAPELDHIIPLSVGGEHSYRNTQCLCRACNQRKGARPLGQMRLFG